MSDHRTEQLNNQMLVSINDASALTGLSRGPFTDAIRDGELKAGKTGNSFRIRRSELDAWVGFLLGSEL